MKRYLFVLLLIVSIGLLVAVESAPSATVGYVKYPSLTGLNFVALPMNQAAYTAASIVGDSYPGQIDAISYWDAATQSWVTCQYYPDFLLWDPDFNVGPGSVLMINALSPFDFYSIGGLPAANAQYNLLVGLNAIMLPLNHSELNAASLVGDNIGTADAVSYWDAATQSWVTSQYYPDFLLWDPDFAVSIGQALMVNSTSAITWPAARAISPVTDSK